MRKIDDTLSDNVCWCSDIFEIVCRNGDRVRIAFAMDCYNREVMSYISTTGAVTAKMVKNLMAESMKYRFGMVDRVPHEIVWFTDNGLAYTAQDTINAAKMMGFKVRVIPHYSPKLKGKVEYFVKTFERDYVQIHDLSDERTVMEQLHLWFENYNNNYLSK